MHKRGGVTVEKLLDTSKSIHDKIIKNMIKRLNPGEINKIIEIVKTGHKLEGKDFTNGNLNKEI